MTIIQLKFVGMALATEIRTWDTSKMQATQEPAMKTLKRLSGLDTYLVFGKGKQGRMNAFNWVNEALELNGMNTISLERKKNQS